MPRSIKAGETTATRLRVYFQLVLASDGITPATAEAGGQPQISSDGAAWTNTGIGTLVAIGNGRYYATLISATVTTPGVWIETRYKSSATAECPGDSVVVTGAVVAKNVTLNNFEFAMRLSYDHNTPAASKTVSAYRSIDGAAFASCLNMVSEIGYGVYLINLDASDLNGRVITFRFTATGCDDTLVTIVTEGA